MAVDGNDLGRLAVARTIQGEIQSMGVIIAYADHPTVTIREPDGKITHWAAHLCEITPLSEDVEVLLINKLHKDVEVLLINKLHKAPW